jgi:hypothetical protein
MLGESLVMEVSFMQIAAEYLIATTMVLSMERWL